MKRLADINENIDGENYLARDVIDVPLQQPIGFLWKPRIRIKANSRPHDPNSED